MDNVVPELFIEDGIKLELLVLGWIALALLIITTITSYLYRRASDDLSFWAPITGVAGFCAVFVIGVWVVLLVPFDSKYYSYYEVSGEVTSVSNVLSEASGDLTRQPVVKIDGLGRPLVVDDPRAVELEGKDVVLRCTIDWNYQAADTYNCKIRSFGE